jgi:hypothetical protein
LKTVPKHRISANHLSQLVVEEAVEEVLDEEVASFRAAGLFLEPRAINLM